jgi:peptidoglycan hydrolase-like protein with peptidoglycan-binding domain
MELLAFTQSAVVYEDTAGEIEDVSLEAIQGRLSQSLWTGLLSAGALMVAFCTNPKTALAALRPGDTGSSVESLQLALSASSYYTGSVTGYYGAMTESAVYAFQRDRGITPDGIAGSETLQALELNPNLDGSSTSNNVSGGGGGGSVAASYNLPADTTNTTGLSSVTAVNTSATSVSPVVTAASGFNTRGVVKTVYGVGINVRLRPAGTIVDGKPDGATVVYDPSSAIDQAGYTWVQISEQGNWVAQRYVADRTTTGGGGGYDGTYRVIALNGVSIYDRPNGSIIGSLPRGVSVSLVGEDVFNGGLIWGQLSASRGWVVKDGLTQITDAGTGSVTVGGVPSGTLRARVVADALIVRDSPAGNDTGAALVQGEIVALTGATVAQSGRTWSELSNGNWVAADFLQAI